MRVLYFLESFGLGGIESFVLNVLENDGCSANSIECCAGRMTTDAFNKRIASLEAPFYCLETRVDGFPGFRYAECARKLATFLAKHSYDVLHIHANHGVDYLFAKIAKDCGISKVVMHSHNTGVTEGAYKKLGHRLFRFAFSKYVDGYFACSEEAARWLLPKDAFNRGGYLFVPNGIDLNAYHFDRDAREELREELGVQGKLVCGHIGRFNYQKNHEFLIDAFFRMHQDNENAVLLLVGEGELRNAVEEKVRSLGLDEAVKFLGPRNDVPRLLSAFDALLFPSRFEGLSVVLVEAQAADLPILASDVISSDTVRSERLQLVPLDVEKWRIAFRTLSENPSERGGQDSRLAPFGIQHSIELMDEGYSALHRRTKK